MAAPTPKSRVVPAAVAGYFDEDGTADVVEAVPVEDSSKEVKAVLRYARGSQHKMRRVIDQIRGRSYEEALMILEYMPYRACEPILKVLVSAAANAKNNHDMKKSNLYVSTAFVDMAPKRPGKRFRCGDKGRPKPYQKHTSHITIQVAERPVAPLN